LFVVCSTPRATRWNRGVRGLPTEIIPYFRPNRSHHVFSPVRQSRSKASWPSAPYGHMAKPYHPCHTNVNPAEEARKYTTEQVYCRRVTLIYNWLPPDRQVENWFRRVPYQLERAKAADSWIVKYFEFRAGIAPLAQLGFIGDLWVSWGAGDPSVWFKVGEMKWERWGGCASSVRGVSWFPTLSYYPFGNLTARLRIRIWDLVFLKSCSK